MRKRKHLGGIKLFLINLLGAFLISWFTVYLMTSTVAWWGAGSMRPGFFWMDAFPYLIAIFTLLLWLLQYALLHSWQDATVAMLLFCSALLLSPYLLNLLPYWQHNLSTPLVISGMMLFWSLPIVVLRYRQARAKELWLAQERILKAKRKAKARKS